MVSRVFSRDALDFHDGNRHADQFATKSGFDGLEESCLIAVRTEETDMPRVEGEEVGIALLSKRVEQGAVPAEDDAEVSFRCCDEGEGGVGVLEEVLEAFVPAVHLGSGLA